MKLRELIGASLSKQKIIVVNFYTGLTYCSGTAREILNNLDYDLKLANHKIIRFEIDTIFNDTICIYILED